MLSEIDSGGHLFSPHLTRRAFLGGGLVMFLVPGGARAAGGARRIVSLDYGLAQTMIALGTPPIAIPAVPDWKIWVQEPPLPPGVANLGNMLEINMEVLQQLEPDLILTTPYLEASRHLFERVAPVEVLPVHATGTPPWPHILAATRRIGALLGRENEAERLIAQSEKTIAQAGARSGRLRDTPCLFVNFYDLYHVRVYGRNSLYQDVLDRMGIPNVWQGETNAWGFSLIGVEDLDPGGNVQMFYFDPVPPDVLPALGRSPLWRNMSFVRSGQIAHFPTVLMFGTLPSATRIATLLSRFGSENGF
ncbi:iron-siderophore ABC transporter substrate-binding protein [Phyllobacterium phragmitis]|uniref:Fe/B12 periplasmic-binding domain-containing protein n=1 Tax=Phyllobacterium phragmitis TaxID=2670329 RepID=A0ABQ0GW54_9HYPH